MIPDGMLALGSVAIFLYYRSKISMPTQVLSTDFGKTPKGALLGGKPPADITSRPLTWSERLAVGFRWEM